MHSAKSRLARLMIPCLIMAPAVVRADGTETLGPPSIPIATGSGIISVGVGMETQPAVMNFNVPGTEVRQALLYWSGEGVPDGDDTLLVDNGSGPVAVTGEAIGDSTLFFAVKGFGNVYFTTYRADVTDLVTTGANTLTLDGMAYGFNDNGAGLLVIYDDGQTTDIQIRDGQDLAYIRFRPPLDVTVPQTFTFPDAAVTRSARVHMFFASVAPGRLSLIRVLVDGGATSEFSNVLGSLDGPDWDTLVAPVTIPAGSTALTVEAHSVEGGAGSLPASFNWLAASLVFLPLCEGVDCDDNDPCTDDICNPDTGLCEYQPTVCDDGNACTDSYCDPILGCVHDDISDDCDDNNACTEDFCDPLLGCFYVDISADCDDGNACTLDRCDPILGCINDDISDDCDDNNACTADDCDPVLGCVYTDISGNCDDGNACTLDRCDPILGCINEDISAGCDDGNACTADDCDPALGCVYTDISGDCDDGNACTADACDPVLGCVNTDISADCDDDNVCTEDTCDPLIGCVHTDISDDCDDDNLCTADSCDPVLGCINEDITSQCDDGVACTINACDPLVGCVYTPDNAFCDDGDPCTVGTCTPTGCTYAPTGLCGGCCIGAVCTVLPQSTCLSQGGRYLGHNTNCVGVECHECGNGILDPGEECDGFDDDACPGMCLPDCTCPENIPTVSEWGLVILTLALLIGLKLKFGYGRPSEFA